MRNIYTREGGRYEITEGEHNVVPSAAFLNPVIIYIRFIVHTFFMKNVTKRKWSHLEILHPPMKSNQRRILLLSMRWINPEDKYLMLHNKETKRRLP